MKNRCLSCDRVSNINLVSICSREWKEVVRAAEWVIQSMEIQLQLESLRKLAESRVNSINELEQLNRVYG